MARWEWSSRRGSVQRGRPPDGRGSKASVGHGWEEEGIQGGECRLGSEGGRGRGEVGDRGVGRRGMGSEGRGKEKGGRTVRERQLEG
jgi:hypothetical protein